MSDAPVESGHLIGGRRVPSADGRLLVSRNPAHSGEVVGVVARGGAAEVDAAVAAARRAFDGWRRVPWPQRGDVVLRAARLLEERKEELARLVTREMGKVLVEARGDVQEAIDMAYYVAGAARRAVGETVPSELPDKWALTRREPVGVVAVVTPWNFPLAIPAWKLFPALLAGNACVFKPAEDTPICALRLAEVLAEAGLPDGVLDVVFGDAEAGEALVRHPGVAHVSFTGSVEVGRRIGEICGAAVRRCALELGGKNAIVVLDDADLELAVDGAVWASFGTTGQRCTAASRLIVHRRVLADVVDALCQRARRLRLGDGLEPGVEVGPLVNEGQLRRVHAYTGIAREEGAGVAIGGEVATEGALAEGWFYRPTVLVDVTPTMRVAREEIFGPTTAVIAVASVEEAVAVANGVDYGLSLSVYTRDLERALRAVDAFEAGIVYVNAPTIGAEIQLPFGGVKQTGNGRREAGSVALDEFTEWKSIYIDYSGRLQRAQIDVDHGSVPGVGKVAPS